MSHPFNDKRSHMVEKARVGRITSGYATGGTPHSDEAQDKALIKRMVKGAAMRADGGAVTQRADRPGRASGGRVKSKSKGTTVNVIVAPAGGESAPHPAVPPAAAPPPAIPMPPPKPPMAGLPPGMPPSAGMPPPGGGMLPPRAKGGRVNRKAGGKVDASQGATKVQHTDNLEGQRANIGRKPVITKATGGAISSEKAPMGPKLPSGSGGGTERRWAQHRGKKNGLTI